MLLESAHLTTFQPTTLWTLQQVPTWNQAVKPSVNENQPIESRQEIITNYTFNSMCQGSIHNEA